MKRLLWILAALFVASPLAAQDIVWYNPPASSFASTGDSVLGLSWQGYVVRTGTNTFTNRSFAADVGETCSNTDGVAGNTTCGIDTAVVDIFSSGTADPVAACSPGALFFRTDAFTFWACTATNTWTKLHSGTLGVAQGGTALATLTAHAVYVGNGASAPTALAIGATNTLLHGVTGADPSYSAVVEGDLTLADVTTKNVSTSAHGFAPKAPNVGTQYLDGTGAWSTPGGSSFDPSTTLSFYNDFVSGLLTTGNVGETGLGFGAISTGTITHVAGLAANPGLLRLNSHATNDNSGAIVYGGNADTATTINSSTWANRAWSLDGLVIFGSNSTAITNTALVFGLTNAFTSEVVANNSDCVWIRHDSDLSDTTFVFVIGNAAGAAGCNSAASSTNVKTLASTITPVAGTAYRLRIRHVLSGVGGLDTIYMRVNDETEKTFCSSGCDNTQAFLNAANHIFFTEYVTRTTTGVLSSDIDYLYEAFSGLVRY